MDEYVPGPTQQGKSTECVCASARNREAQNEGKLTVLSMSAWAALEKRENTVEMLKTTKLHDDYRKKTKHMASVITSLMKRDSTGQQKVK